MVVLLLGRKTELLIAPNTEMPGVALFPSKKRFNPLKLTAVPPCPKIYNVWALPT